MAENVREQMEAYTEQLLKLGQAHAEGHLKDQQFIDARENLMELTSGMGFQRPSKVSPTQFLLGFGAFLLAVTIWVVAGIWSCSSAEPSHATLVDELERLSALHDQKAISNGEYEKAKALLLDSAAR